MGFACYPIEKFNTAGPKKTKWSLKDYNYGPCHHIRDSRNISGIVGIFFFSLMMIIFIVSMETKKDYENPQTRGRNIKSFTRSFKLFSSDSAFCEMNEGTIECTDIDSSVMKRVQEEINQLSSEEFLSITFKEIGHPTEVIKPNWLSDVKKKLLSLTITNTALGGIKSDSFKGSPFEDMSILSLSNIGDLSLNNNSFSGLSKLNTLSIQGPNCHLLNAEGNVLESLTSLSSLQITYCSLSPETLKNMTGGKPAFSLPELKIFDLQKSSIGKLLSESFSKLPNLASLYLQWSNLSESVETTVFRGIHPEQIDMDHTMMTKLPEGVFDSVIKYKVKISFREVHFNCSCDFKWFKDFYIDHKEFFEGKLSCCSEYNECVDLATFPFCESTSSTSLSPATTEIGPTGNTPLSSSSIPSTTPEGYEPTPCLPANRSYFTFEKQNSDFIRVIYLGRRRFKLTFSQVGNTPSYRVTVDTSLSNNLVLLLMTRQDWTFCLSDIQDNFILEDLNYGETYTICIMESGKQVVSPKSCQSLTVPQEWGKQSWINNNQKLPALIGVSSVFFLILLTSVFGVCCYVKRNPNLVYGKDNVIVVERENSKKTNEQVQNYEQQKYPPSLVSWSDGYLTPKVYESVEDFSIPCVGQYPSEYLERPRIYPAVRLSNRRTEELDTVYSQSGGIYESVNYCPSLYYVNEDMPNKAYSTV